MAKYSQSEIQDWLVKQISTELGMEASEVDINATIASLGVDSITMVHISSQMERWLETEIDPASLYKYPTITDLARFLHTKD